jgi:two-component system, sensor histidine kinase and response regulator
MKGDRERCLGAGMDDYLTKPVRPAELDEVITRFTSRRRSAGPLVPAPSGSCETAPPALPVFDPSVLDGLGDEKVRGSLIELFLVQARDHLADLGEAVANEDQERTGRLAHSLKGSAAVIGAARLSDLADRLCRSATGGCPQKAVALLADLEHGLRLTTDALAALR